MPKPSQYQEKVRQGNRMFVLSLLKDEPMRFSELQDLSGMSPRGLAKILADLSEDKLVNREIKGRWLAYAITKKGRFAFSDTMTLGIIMDQIQKEGGEYHHNYSGIKTLMESSGLSWGIQDDVIMNKDIEENVNPILFEIIKDIQKNIYLKIKEISKIKKINITKKEDKIILGLIIDYNQLIKSINENSFESYQNMHKSSKKPKNKFVKANEALSELEPI